MIESLDIKSVTFLGTIAGISISIAMLLNWQVQKRQPGVAQWALAYIFGSIGLLLIGLRDAISPFASIIVANVLLTSYWCMIWLGIRQFVGRSSRVWLLAVLLMVIHLCANLYFLFIVPDVATRVAIYCIIEGIIVLLCARELFRHARQIREQGIYLALGVMFIAQAIFDIVRIVTIASSLPIENLLTAESIHKLAFVEGIALSAMLACSLVVASNQRLRLILEDYQNKLEDLASTDDLSKLYNRRHFIELSSREIDRARRYGRPLSLIMLDIDHFKSINDMHGHRCGDEVIMAISQMMRRELREQDVISRIGGEEFAVLMPETSADIAAEVAERLRAAQEAARTPCDNGIEVACTASFGITELNEGDTTVYDMLPRADQALYVAKNSGRNCIMLSGQGTLGEMVLPLD